MAKEKFISNTFQNVPMRNYPILYLIRFYQKIFGKCYLISQQTIKSLIEYKLGGKTKVSRGTVCTFCFLN